MKYDNYAKQFLKNINDCIDERTKEYVTIKSATISRVNDNGTVDIEFPEDGGTWSNVTNQSIYQNLKVGDEVKLIQQNGILKNCWIIGAFQTNKKQNILQQVTEEMQKTQVSNAISINNDIYIKTTEIVNSLDSIVGPSISAEKYPYKFCIHSVTNTADETVTDYLYYSKRESSEFVWKLIL